MIPCATTKKDAVAKLPLHLLIFPHFADKTPHLDEDFALSFSKKNLEGGAVIRYYYLDKRRP